MKHINVIYGQNVEFFHFKIGDIYSHYCALKGYQIIGGAIRQEMLK
jgi:hypothetical protein